MLTSDKSAIAYKLPSVARAPRRESRRARILEKCTLTDARLPRSNGGLARERECRHGIK
jgi:hypothetical protein